MSKKPLVFSLIFSLFILSIQAQQWNGYTLLAAQNASTAILVDTNGTTFQSWTFASNKKTGYSSYMLPGGSIARAVSNAGNSLNGGGITGAIQVSDWDGNVTWDFVYSTSTYCLHHDFCPLPNGNFLLISYDVRTAAEITAAGSSVSHSMWLEKIIEVHPTGASTGDIVWEWHVYDHLCQNVDNTKANYVSSIIDHPELLNINYQNTAQTQDWMHMNGIDYDAELDQIVFSSHMLNEMYVIDHSTTTAEAAGHTGGNSGKGGDFLYRWGNPASYGGTGSADFNVVHDGHFVPAGCPHAGGIAGFNNNGISNSQSCVDIIDAPHVGFLYDVTPGSNMIPSTYSQRVACTGHSNNMGNSEQFPNGNMMICVAQTGLVYEIDPSGTTIWSKSNSGTIPQAHRYTACYLFGTPETPTISQSGNTLTSSTGSAYQWYLNGVAISGATSQSIDVTVNGTYQVAILNQTCSSDLSNAIDMAVAVNEISEIEFNVYPNPANDRIQLSGIPLNTTIQIIDYTGRVVKTVSNTKEVDVADLATGAYIVKVNQNNAFGTKVILIQK
jgi:Arylsulfotransferase (ASST)/Secretion system C-terminal sorting domain